MPNGAEVSPVGVMASCNSQSNDRDVRGEWYLMIDEGREQVVPNVLHLHHTWTSGKVKSADDR